MRRLHLLEVGLRWPPEAYLQRKLEGLAARGLRVTVAAEIDRGTTPQRVPGVELLRLSRGDEPRLVKAFWLIRDGLALALRDPRRLRRLLRAVRRPRLLRASLPLVLADADVVHFEWESTALDFLPLFEAYGSPIVVSSHGGINVRPQIGDARITKAGLSGVKARTEGILGPLQRAAVIDGFEVTIPVLDILFVPEAARSPADVNAIETARANRQVVL